MGWANDQIALLIISATGTFSGLFVYSPSPGARNLIGSIVAAAGTDPYGNAYLNGITNYTGGATPIAVGMAAGFVVFSQAPAIGGPFTPFGTLGPFAADFEINVSGNLQLFAGGANSIIANSPLEVLAATDLDGALDVSGLATFNGQVNVLTLPVNIEAMATPATPGSGTKLFSPNSGGLQGHLTTIGTDGNTWATETLTIITQGQLINSTTPAGLTGVSVPVILGTTYKINAMIPYSSTVAAGTPVFNFALSGTATIASGFMSAIFGGVAGAVTMPVRSAASTGNITGPTLAVATFVMWLEAIIDVGTANGNLSLTAAEGTATDTFSIIAGGYFAISPVA